ncbi:MAG: glycosyltransferase family 2 protein [Muribaculaceae bacterium]|nr:glycosyltransferase family 2 protein [Muribaculaceae bacterium]
MKESASILTVVVPVYNRAGMLSEFLESLQGQDVRGFKLIVVDNCSTDGSRGVAEQWGKVNPDIPTLVLTEPRRGAAAARQRGLEEVDTEWTLFFDSDDLMLPGHIGRVLRHIYAHPETDIWGWNVKTDLPGGVVRYFHSHPSAWTNVMNGTFATSRYCARTSLFRKAGGWNPEIGLWDDIELGARLLRQKPKIEKIVGEELMVVRVLSESITGDSYTGWMRRMEPALQSIESGLRGRDRFITDIKRAQTYGGAAREGSVEAVNKMQALLGRTSGRLRRLALRYIYRTVRCGIRGTYLLLKPFYDR